jgi:hypothetical protein
MMRGVMGLQISYIKYYANACTSAMYILIMVTLQYADWFVIVLLSESIQNMDYCAFVCTKVNILYPLSCMSSPGY